MFADITLFFIDPESGRIPGIDEILSCSVLCLFAPRMHCLCHENEISLKSKATSAFHFTHIAGPCNPLGMKLALVKLTGLIITGLMYNLYGIDMEFN